MIRFYIDRKSQTNRQKGRLPERDKQTDTRRVRKRRQTD